MRLLVLSDLHLEIWGNLPLGLDLDSTCPDVVVLAGDIHSGPAAVKWAEETFRYIPTLYVSGNHEGYGDRIDEVEQRIAEACAASPTVTYLQQTEAVIGGVRFLGCTLWTDFALFGEDQRHEAMLAAQRAMSDYRVIRLAKRSGRRLHPIDTLTWHQRHASWLAERLASPFDGPTVVVTHMAPSRGSLAQRFESDLVSSAFVSEREELVAQADVWIHGHTHDSFDYRVGRCRVVCNPRGYPQRNGDPENPRFDPNLIVEVAADECQ